MLRLLSGVPNTQPVSFYYTILHSSFKLVLFPRHSYPADIRRCGANSADPMTRMRNHLLKFVKSKSAKSLGMFPEI